MEAVLILDSAVLTLDVVPGDRKQCHFADLLYLLYTVFRAGGSRVHSVPSNQEQIRQEKVDHSDFWFSLPSMAMFFKFLLMG